MNSPLTLALVRAFREAGQVQRCHTSGVSNGYDVARHSFNALSMLLVLHPDASTSLIKAVLWHDAPERWLGDVPSPALRAYGEQVRKAYEDTERELFDALGVPHHGAPGQESAGLDIVDLWWLYAVDKLELYMWCREQLANGVTTFRGHIAKLDDWFLENDGHIPSRAAEFWRELRRLVPIGARHDDDPRAFIKLTEALRKENEA